MSLRFWRRIRIFPHVSLNISKTGFSITIGRRGINWTIGKKGNTASVGLPGTGLSYRKHISHPEILKNKKDKPIKEETADKNNSNSVLDEFK
jgi:uncharacterized protein DUF4236